MDITKATAEYWRVKQAFHGHDKKMTTEQGLRILTKVLSVVGPHHPLAQQAEGLRQTIIIGDD